MLFCSWQYLMSLFSFCFWIACLLINQVNVNILQTLLELNLSENYTFLSIFWSSILCIEASPIASIVFFYKQNMNIFSIISYTFFHIAFIISSIFWQYANICFFSLEYIRGNNLAPSVTIHRIAIAWILFDSEF